MIAPLRSCPIYGVAADGECFNKREFLVRETLGRVKLICADDESLAQYAIGVHAEYLKFLTAIAKTAAARKALHVIHIRLDRASVAWLDVAYVQPDIDHLDSQLVSGNARVTEQ